MRRTVYTFSTRLNESFKAIHGLDFSPRLDALRGLPEGRGFSPAEIAAPALCWSRAPRSPAGAGLRGTRDTGIIRKAL
jgi:hypothetical protein